MGEAAKPLLFACFQLWKLAEVSHEMFVLVLPPVSFRVSGFLVASPCLRGKLQNLYVVRDIRQNFHTPLETFEKQRFFSFPHRHGEATGNLETREDTWEHQNEHFVRDSSNFDTLQPPNRRFPTSFLWNFKIDVSCEASINFQHISQTATPATEFAPCRHLTRPCQCDSQKTRNTTRLKCCACHAKWRWTRAKCCPCHEKCNASSENVAKVLRLPHKTIFDTLQNTSNVTKCHACHANRSNEKFETSKNDKNDHLCRTYHRHGHMGIARTVADGCGHKRDVERTHPQPPDPQNEMGTLATHSGKTIIGL